MSRNPFFSPDAQAAERFADYLDEVRKAGSSIGAVIEIIAEGVPAGWGAPIYGKLDAELAAALMSINAVKGVEIGDGFAAAELSGEQNADEMRQSNDGRPRFLSNHAGGVLGGISTGQPVVARFAVKPTSSILRLAAQSLARPRRRKSSPKAAMTLASAFAPCRSAKRWLLACLRMLSCGIEGRSALKAVRVAPPIPRQEAECGAAA